MDASGSADYNARMTNPPQRVLLIEPPFHRLFKDSYSLERYPLSLGYSARAMIKDSTSTNFTNFTNEAEHITESFLATKDTKFTKEFLNTCLSICMSFAAHTVACSYFNSCNS
jgi:hypothetical protein